MKGKTATAHVTTSRQTDPPPPPTTSSQLPTPLDWVNKGFAICQAVSSGHIQDPVPLIDKSRALFPGGRVPPSFIHQVIIITGLNKL